LVKVNGDTNLILIPVAAADNITHALGVRFLALQMERSEQEVIT
jgi:hypothetical protein